MTERPTSASPVRSVLHELGFCTVEECGFGPLLLLVESFRFNSGIALFMSVALDLQEAVRADGALRRSSRCCCRTAGVGRASWAATNDPASVVSRE